MQYKEILRVDDETVGLSLHAFILTIYRLELDSQQT